MIPKFREAQVILKQHLKLQLIPAWSPLKARNIKL